MTIKERITYAETMLEDVCRNAPDDIASIRYWVGYLDALRGVQDEIQKHSSEG